MRSREPKSLWVLPHRKQSEESHVLVDGRKRRLEDALDVKQLPKGLVLGIPEEAISKHGKDSGLVFAQLFRQPDLSRAVLSVSVVCGKDISDRIVFLTLLRFYPIDECPLLEIPREPELPAEESKSAEMLRYRMHGVKDKWILGIRDLIDAYRRHPRYLSFSNVELVDAHFKPDWTPQKKTKLLAACLWVIVVVIACALATYDLLSRH